MCLADTEKNNLSGQVNSNTPGESPGYFTITKEWLFENSCAKNTKVWTKSQTDSIGVQKTSGWMDACRGKKITLKQKRRFEEERYQEDLLYACNLQS